jgi:PTH1 family peptidyl-tRNA hydrolase
VWLVVGLGNPGPRYERNRHNIGFRAVDELARSHGLPAWKSGGKLGGETTTGVITTPRGRQKVLLLKPMEFMNHSGFPVQRVASFHDVTRAEVLVLHDELDLDFGVVRLKQGGGHGGHNGLRSIIEQAGGNDFARIRLGIGKPGPVAGTADGGAAAARAAGNPAAAAGGKDVAGWVLSDFPTAQAAILDGVIAAGREAVEAIVGLGIGPAMNQLNGRPRIIG